MHRGCGMLVSPKWPARRVYVCNLFIQLLTSHIGRGRLLPAACNLARCDSVAIWSFFLPVLQYPGSSFRQHVRAFPSLPSALVSRKEAPCGGKVGTAAGAAVNGQKEPAQADRKTGRDS